MATKDSHSTNLGKVPAAQTIPSTSSLASLAAAGISDTSKASAVVQTWRFACLSRYVTSITATNTISVSRSSKYVMNVKVAGVPMGQ